MGDVEVLEANIISMSEYVVVLVGGRKHLAHEGLTANESRALIEAVNETSATVGAVYERAGISFIPKEARS